VLLGSKKKDLMKRVLRFHKTNSWGENRQEVNKVHENLKIAMKKPGSESATFAAGSRSGI